MFNWETWENNTEDCFEKPWNLKRLSNRFGLIQGVFPCLVCTAYAILSCVHIFLFMVGTIWSCSQSSNSRWWVNYKKQRHCYNVVMFSCNTFFKRLKKYIGELMCMLKHSFRLLLSVLSQAKHVGKTATVCLLFSKYRREAWK